MALKFNQQKGIDFCGSSATAIAVEFITLFVNRSEPKNPLSVSRFVITNVAKSMHKEPSASVKPWKPIQHNMPLFKCDFPDCNYQIKSRDRRALTSHVNMTHRNPRINK